MTLVIKNGIVVDVEQGTTSRNDVLIDGDTIAAVGTGLTGDEVIDATDRIVLPGFVDTHRHTWQGELRALLPDGDFPTYLRTILGERAPRFTPQDVHAGNLAGARECVASGITTLLDWSQIQHTPEHTDAAIEALREAGIRAVYAYSHGDPAVSRRELARLRPGPLLTLQLAALGPEFIGDEGARRERAVADDLGLPVTVHMRGDSGIGVFGPGTTYVHATSMTREGLKRIAGEGGMVSVSPFSEIRLAMGRPPLGRAMAEGISVALGGDTVTGGPGDMFSLMRAMLVLDPGLTTRDILKVATIGGARVLGLGEVTGSIRPGKQADLVLLRTDTPGMAATHDPIGAVVMNADVSAVDTVMVAGLVRKPA
ncbi:amidohydrolase family protein [Streptosporangium sp. NPDC048865]|uniref:amidohydrolase family protein n=1 Tax=Streptosporangium sp. NPDC048865 TaxID=3155766 RepID=UPI00343C536E